MITHCLGRKSPLAPANRVSSDGTWHCRTIRYKPKEMRCCTFEVIGACTFCAQEELNCSAGREKVRVPVVLSGQNTKQNGFLNEQNGALLRWRGFNDR